MSHENFDIFVIEKHIANDKCRPPYLSALSRYPVCNTKEKMKRSTIGLGIGKGKEYVKPCLSMSKVDFQYSTDKSWFTSTSFGIGVTYPEQIKIINQSQAVDFHSLIGNIGGYIGLFLGMINWISKIM